MSCAVVPLPDSLARLAFHVDVRIIKIKEK
jgi:hypothetical protein